MTFARLPLGVDDEGRALDAHVLLAREALLDPDAVPLRDRVILVGEERERELVLVAELRMRCLVVRAHAEDDRAGLLELAPRVADAAGLLVQPGVSSRG